MSKLLSLVLLSAFAIGCLGCSGGTEAPPASDAPAAAEEGGSEAGGEGGEQAMDEPAPANSESADDAAKDIVDTAVGADGFNTLVAAVKAAGLVETLKSEGPFTVFAPTDDAFAKLPEGTLDDLLLPENKDQLVAILTYHVVPGKVMAADVVKLQSAKTVQGSEVAIAVADGKVSVDSAQVVTTDIECSNGVIHVIDSVILPKE